ncbi:MAG: DUF1152 domain-containing protein [Thermoprotei archaeon]|nr:DUF1152 domain-containing protein [Thermoprotei archaeon]
MASLNIDSLEEFSGMSRVLVVGIGGGGDTLGALLVYLKIRGLGGKPVLGNVVWERLVLDPFPGPIPLEQLVNAEILGRSIAIVDSNTYVDRYGYTLKPQIVTASEVLGEKTVFFDISKGEEGLLEALDTTMDKLGVEAIVGVDVGGDAIAVGCEEDLWSPLTDAISVSALHRSRVPSIITILAPGADGEMSQHQVIKRVSEIASKGGLIGVYGVNRREYKILKSASSKFVSEASKIPIEAFEGFMGNKKIRWGSRNVEVNPISTTLYALNTETVYNMSRLAPTVRGTRSIDEARRRLNDRCIYTELNLEEDLANLRAEGGAFTAMSVLEVRSAGRRRLLLSGCNPLC